ncbi:MAG: hypothetical protein IBJ03_03025 [Gemmatimonadaceae bacterium]|nr:hypothetical protein [Gemmatimonadaceae bacterium]
MKTRRVVVMPVHEIVRGFARDFVRACKRTVLLIGVLFAGTHGTAHTAAAQTTVTTLRGLAFGSVTSGVSKAIAANSANSLSFRISGVLGVGGGFSFTLPTSLPRVGGGASLPVTFCTTCGIYRLGTNSPTGGIVFNPNNGVLGLTVLVNSDIYVWLGATANPPLNQAGGTYSGTVTINVFAIL